MKRGIKSFFNHIGSRRFAIILLIVTTTIILITNLIPNPILMAEEEAERFIRERPLLYRISNTFQVMNITGSPFFLVIPSFIVLSVTICTYKRARQRMAAKAEAVPPPGAVSHSASVDKGTDIGHFLEKRGWSVNERPDAEGILFSGAKGAGGIWGSVLFHAGLNIVVTGGIVSMLTMFNGEVALTEGFQAYPQEQLKNILNPPELAKFPYREMFLESFEARYIEGGGFPLDYTAILKTVDIQGRVGDETIKVNQPLRKKGYQFMLTKYFFAPRFVITEKETGRLIEDAFINLLITSVDMSDEFDIPETGVRIKAWFFPDFYRESNRPKTRSMNLDNPAFVLEFFKGTEKLGDGILPLGKRMDFDEGRYTIQFIDLKKWINLSVSRDHGLPIVKWGLLFLVSGLALRFALNEKKVWIKVTEGEDKDRVEISGSALYFPALFEEEMKRLAEELRRQEATGVET